MGRFRTWLLVGPVLAAGLYVGHEAGYRLAIPHEHDREEALASAGHAYFAYAPYLGALLLACAIVALASRARTAYSGQAARSPSWAFALAAPLGFVLLELFERMAGHDGVGAAFITTPEVLIGLALQLPFALVALLLARLLASAAEAVGRALRSAWSPPLLRPSLLSLAPATAPLPRISTASLAYGVRGPPPPS